MAEDRQLVSGAPVPADHSHTQLKANGQQQDYVVLTPEERAKGFVKPVRHKYVHAMPSEFDRKVGCGAETRMGAALAETYAANPHFYSGTFCVGCGAHHPLNEFTWLPDGEPMDPSLQEAWHRRREMAAFDRWSLNGSDYDHASLADLLQAHPLEAGNQVWRGKAVLLAPLDMVDADDVIAEIHDAVRGAGGADPLEPGYVAKAELDRMLDGWVRRNYPVAVILDVIEEEAYIIEPGDLQP